MTNLPVLFSNIAAGEVRDVVYLFLVFRLLKTNKPNRKSIAAAFLGTAVIFAFFYVAGLPDLFSIVSETLWIALCARYFQGADVRMALFLGIFYKIAISFWQFLIAAWLGVCFHAPAFLDYDTGKGQFALWFLHTLLVFLTLYILRHPDLIGKKLFRFGSVILVAGFIAVISLSQQTILAIPEDTLDMWTLLSVVLMLSVLVFHMNRQYELEKELVSLKSQQSELLERDYTALNHAYAMNAKLFHDFHNHIGVLRQLLSHKKFEEAIQYLDGLQTPIQNLANTIWTGDETIDYLINSKAAAAKSDGILYQAQVEFPRHTNLGSADLCAILGNLLDNALEAARKVPESKQPFVKLTIRRINHMLIIKIENSFLNPPIEKDGLLKTSKNDNGLHGWGLKSARTAAEKYDGMVQTSYTDNIFCAVVTLSYQGIPNK